MCAHPGQMCVNEMMHIDRMGGAGVDSQENKARLKQADRWTAAEASGEDPTLTSHPQANTGQTSPDQAGHDAHTMQ